MPALLAEESVKLGKTDPGRSTENTRGVNVVPLVVTGMLGAETEIFSTESVSTEYFTMPSVCRKACRLPRVPMRETVSVRSP